MKKKELRAQLEAERHRGDCIHRELGIAQQKIRRLEENDRQIVRQFVQVRDKHEALVKALSEFFATENLAGGNFMLRGEPAAMVNLAALTKLQETWGG